MSKPQRRRDILMKSELSARCSPGQMRRPNPKGRSNDCRRGFVVVRNRSGLKVSGEGKRTGSCMIPLGIIRIRAEGEMAQ